MKRILWAMLTLLIALPAHAVPNTRLALSGGTFWTMRGKGLGVVKEGLLLIENGKIVYVGKPKPIPAGYRVLDTRGKIIMPGMIDAITHLGLVEVALNRETNDGESDASPIVPQLRALDAFNVSSRALRPARIAGITTVLSAPWGRNPIAGQSFLIKLTAGSVTPMVLRSSAALHLNLGERPKQLFSPKRRINSRMGVVATIRQAFVEAQNYQARWSAYRTRRRGSTMVPPARDLKLDVLVQALQKQLPVIISAHRADDILTARRLAKEFGLRWILRGATGAYRVASLLARDNVPVIIGMRMQRRRMEHRLARLDNAAQLHRAGVTVVFGSSDVYNVRNLPYAAAYAVAYGLPRVVALRALTIGAATLFGLQHRLGSLSPKKDADLVVFSGDPLRLLTAVEWVIVDGVPSVHRPQQR